MTTTRDDTIDFTMMYATHNAFRRDLALLIEAADRGRPDAIQIRHGWENFKTQLLLHHSVEDTNLWPRLREVLADRTNDLVLIDEMEAEHHHLEPAVAAVDAALADGLSALACAARELKVLLEYHLEHEEDDALPLMQSVLTSVDWMSFAGQMRRSQGIKGAAVYVPWILDGTSPSEQHQFLALLPVPVRFFNRLFWEPRYRKQHRWSLGSSTT
jgi:hemerythrin-like domain-containing protein